MTSARWLAGDGVTAVIARGLLVTLGVASIAGGIVLATVITVTWWPCADEIPLGDEFSPECHELAADEAPLLWVQNMWFIAAPLTILAVVAAQLRGMTDRMRSARLALILITVVAFPIVEYATFAGPMGVWDALPWAGTGSAVTAVLAGTVMLAASRRPARARTGERVAP